MSVQNAATSGRNNYLKILDAAWKDHKKPRKKNAPTVISTFAGCGGSSLGYSMAGFKELLAVEWDDNAVATFKANFPAVFVYHGDIAKLSVEDCLKRCNLEVGELDVFDGSPPCQGFSMAGKREMSDGRNQLFREYVRLLHGLQPKAFVMENVSGMVKGKMKLIFAEILTQLKACGYQVKAWLLNAMYFQVPQSRQRIIFVGIRDNLKIGPTCPKAISSPISTHNAIWDLHDNGKELTPEAAKYWPLMRPGESANRYHPKGHLFGLIKLDPNKPAPTQTRSAGASRPCHWLQPRFIGIKERARIGAFPDEYRWCGSWANVYDRIGNSVPPLMMRAIAQHIRKLLDI